MGMSRALLTVKQMARADAMAMAAGVDGERLMEAAGWAVARETWKRFSPCRVAVLCGPGNNGGDGFVAARQLRRRGYQVRLGLLGDVSALKGDAAAMASRWSGVVEPLTVDVLDRADVVIDAVFGAGLSRPVEGTVAGLFAEIERRALPVVAVDVPSGLDGDSGAVLGGTIPAVATVTFFRKKPGHLLLPGRAICGHVTVADIGIPVQVLDTIGPDCFENDPVLWKDFVPAPGVATHKYDRGHVLLVSGEAMTGAIRLAALAARRAGAGLATVVAPAKAADILRGCEAGTIVAPLDRYAELLSDPRYNVVVVGPGSGVSAETRLNVLNALLADKKTVLDADALTSFAGNPDDLFRRTGERCVMTPHEGEFRKLWGKVEGDKIARARHAAMRSGGIVLLKGADTVIAHPDGRAIVNSNAPPWLATAGAGDVLAGMIAGYMAQGMQPFWAAAAACWLHGKTAQRIGPGMIAEDMLKIALAVV